MRMVARAANPELESGAGKGGRGEGARWIGSHSRWIGKVDRLVDRWIGSWIGRGG